MSNNKSSISWIWIVVLIIVFWPAGVYLIYKKLGDNQKAVLNYGKTVTVVSYILIGVGIIYLFMSITDRRILQPALGFVIIGVLVHKKSKKMKAKRERYKKYIAAVNQSSTSIAYIASEAGVSYEIVAKELQELINKGYFEYAYIDQNSRTFNLPHMAQQSIVPEAGGQTQFKIIACSSCGANNTIIVGQMNECEYCGSPLQ